MPATRIQLIKHATARLIMLYFLVSLFPVSYAKQHDSTYPVLLSESFELLADRVSITDSDRLRSPALVKKFYDNTGWKPVWIDNISSRNLILELLEKLDHAESHGLFRSSYHLDYIKSALAGAISADNQYLYKLELLLTDAFLSYTDHMLHGQINPKTAYPDWRMVSTEADVTLMLEQAILNDSFRQFWQQLYPIPSVYTQLVDALAQYRRLSRTYQDTEIEPGLALHLNDSGTRVKLLKEKLSLLDGPLSVDDDRFDQATLNALKKFQKRHGLEADGIAGRKTLAALNIPLPLRIRQIQINLERLRWLPRDPGDNYIVVNIADFRLHVIENHRPVMSSRVIVGKQYHETPVFSSDMTYMVLNPYWYVPRSIAINEILPALRNDPDYLKRKRMRVFDFATRRVVDTQDIDWSTLQARDFKYSFRQEPGFENALGQVKFMFPNQYNVYLHDTPAKRLFADSVRDFSHGCIRVQDAMELTHYILRKRPDLAEKEIDNILRSGREKIIALEHALPVLVLYFTAWAENGVIQFRNDVYGRDKSLISALFRQDKNQ